MSELHPDLKRLMKWTRGASPPRPEEAPFGFSRRVVAPGKPVQVTTLFDELQRAAWGLACASLALIVCCAVIWVSQPSVPTPAADLASALNMVASDLAQ
jgi:hypothetical protein